MLFSSITFLYYFLPLTLAVYFLTPKPGGSLRLRNLVLLAVSLLFYAWGEPMYALLMVGQALSGWLFGLAIGRGGRAARPALIGSLAVGLGGLMFFKYSDFFIANVNALTSARVPALGLALPIGISFYTFQILSYDIDLYRKQVAVQRNFFSFAAYVTFFPQLIAGPIVRYADIAHSLGERAHSVERFAAGARRFAFGLGKKVLLANVLGELVALLKTGGERSVLAAWLYAAAYALHIYFDFSGYSDMAIGLGKIFGFDFLENFNYPYIAQSITDFWRRWHISLSSWFRDYVYIPLGGSRVGAGRHIFNILAVWFLTGFWHGAGWNFIVWGMYFAALLLLEKFVLSRVLDRLPSFARHLYLLVLVLIGWVFFDAPDLGTAASRIALMFGAGADGFAGADSLYYLRSYLVPLLLAAVGATPLPSRLAAWLRQRRVMTALEPLAVAALLFAVTAFLVDGSFNPFIYFRF